LGRVAKLRLRALWCAVLLLFMSGCDVGSMHIQLAGFRNGDIDGIWLWRLDETGNYTRVCRFPISDPYYQNGVEVVAYGQACNDGLPPGTPLLAQVERAADDPETVTLWLVFQRASRPLGLYRVSAYNSVGESDLSSAVVQL
jgi:hypothetical protein